MLEIGEVLLHYDLGNLRSAVVLSGGKVNTSYRVETDRGIFLVQNLNPLIDARITEDADLLAFHLEKKGFIVQRAVRSRNGECVVQSDGAWWRVLTWIEGEMLAQKDTTLAHIKSAAHFVGRFSDALTDFDIPIRVAIPHFHDTAFHISRMGEVVEQQSGEKKELVAPLAEKIISLAREVPSLSLLPLRVLHGDPKLNNIVFDHLGEAIALIDLDTIGRYVTPLDVGDMLRSFLSIPLSSREEIWNVALSAYVDAAAFLTPQEKELIHAGFRTVTLELAARYLTDAIEEKFFSFDAAQFPTASAHHLNRARQLIDLAQMQVN